jgi:hypothetical protein
MNSDHDPLTDPQAGDVVEALVGAFRRRVVVCRDTGSPYVRYCRVLANGKSGMPIRCTVAAWRDWCLAMKAQSVDPLSSGKEPQP